MPSFSTSSKEKLATAHSDLQKLFDEVIKYFDCTVLYGYRLPAEQFELFKKGREFVHGQWAVVDPKHVVTDKDGFDKKSKHNYLPSKAVDVVPFPINFKDVERTRYFAGYVMGIASQMYRNGEIGHEVVSGLDWDSDTDLSDTRLKDAPHYQIKG